MNIKNMIKILVITIFVINGANCLKRNKNGSKDKKANDLNNNNAPVTKIQEHSKQKPVQTTQVTHTTTTQTKQTKQTKKQQKTQQSVQQKFEAQQSKVVDMSGSYQFQFLPKQNQYVIPAKVGSQDYSLAMIYDEKQSKQGQNLPWFFTSLSGQDHNLCDASDDCQQVSKILKCQSDKSKTQADCYYSGKAKYSTQLIQSKKKAKIKFNNNGLIYQMDFISPTKINMKDNKVGQNQINGLINLALDNNQKYSKSMIVSNKIVKIVSQKQLQQAVGKQGVIELGKTNFFSFSSSKQIHVKTIHAKTKKVSTDIKQSYQKIKIKFNNVQKTMAVSKNILTVMKNTLKKQYFGDRCKAKQDTITCSAAPVKNITKLFLCRDSSQDKCLELPILKWIVKQEKPNNVYKLLIEENKDKDGDNTIILYPRLTQICEIYGENGVIKGIKQIDKGSQTDEKEEEEQTKQQQSQKIATKTVEQPKKQAAKKEEKVKQQSQQQEQEQEDKQQEKQTQKQKQQQQQQQKQKQTQTQQQKTKQNSKKQVNKKQKHEDEDQVQQKKQKTKQQQTQQQQQKPVAKSQNTKKEKQKQKQPQTKDQQQQQEKPKPKSKKKSKVKHMQEQADGKEGSREQQRKYSKGILFFVFVYGLIFIVILIIIKFKAQQSIAAAAIDRFLDITWYGIVKNYFNKSKGYNAPKFEEDEGAHSQQIDHSDSVAVGYTEKEGRDLFWEKNSVEGI